MFYGEVVYAILTPLAIVGLLVLAILALAGRGEPDARGDRAYVLYLSLVSFIALFTLLFAIVDVSSTATGALLVDDSDACTVDPFSPECAGPGFEIDSHGSGEARTRDLLNTAGVALAAGAVLLFHRRLTRAHVEEPGFGASPGARTFTAYLYAVAFTAVLTFVVAAAIALPALVRSVAPGLTSTGSSTSERDAALTDLVPALVAAGGAAVIYVTHWRAAHRLRRGET